MTRTASGAGQRAQQVALFRYQLICPAPDPGLSTKARGMIVRAIADGTHAARSAGSTPIPRHAGPVIRRYRAGGFDALTLIAASTRGASAAAR
jgi:putative transposase